MKLSSLLGLISGIIPLVASLGSDAAGDSQIISGTLPVYGNDAASVLFRRAMVNSASRARYIGFNLAEDGHDFIEWTAQQPWCTGKVGMSGNSWLAISQLFIAAERPPHLSAIAPWEALTDVFRNSSNRGGIAVAAFNEEIITTFSVLNYIEDVPRMILNNQLMNDYWQDKSARLEHINDPAYIIGSYTNAWPDYYQPEHVHDLRRFFDRYLKDDNSNDWVKTPRVRLAILDPGHEDELNRPAPQWPVPGLQNRTLFLQPNGLLDSQAANLSSRVGYKVNSNSSQLTWSLPVEELTDIIGYMNLRLWVQANGSDDMELAVTVEKTDSRGQPYKTTSSAESSSIIAATEYLRVSARHLDEARSTPFEPY